ncbi:MAG: HAMP domain-containing histidine kinase [Oscillospiraceae bacterium]|nr:HAMP domain-containing histidine kinase [Oscillospiraceae bacterium]
MKAFNRIAAAVTAVIILVFAAANFLLLTQEGTSGRAYRVEISRLVHAMENGGTPDLSQCSYVTAVVPYGEDFYTAESDYVIREIGGELYRFDYRTEENSDKNRNLLLVNALLAVMAAVMLAVLLYIRLNILRPFEKLSNVPYELSRGNLSSPVKEMKNRFFGRFLWGVDLLRENMEQQKERELDLQRERKMLLLSLSHDIKTPLSAIKLYAKALSKGLYKSAEKQAEIAESINTKADEIESYVSQIIAASRDDLLSLDVNMSEFYL